MPTFRSTALALRMPRKNTTTIIRCISMVAVTSALMLTSTFAMADNGKHGHSGKWGSHRSSHEYEREYNHHRDDSRSEHRQKAYNAQASTYIRYDNDHREDIARYLDDDYRGHCPPGLAKKHNGCTPPGLAKKRYVVGEVLPRDVMYYPIPSNIVRYLSPAPYGYQYVRVDKDVLLMSEATKKILDAITLFSGVGK